MNATTAADPVRGFVRDVGLLARFELGESVRSRLLLVMVLLFVGGGALGAWGYTTRDRQDRGGRRHRAECPGRRQARGHRGPAARFPPATGTC